MKRGDVYDARLDPAEGSEQSGSRPVVIVSRDAINISSPIVSAVPCTTYREGRRVYPSQVLVRAPEGGLTAGKPAAGRNARPTSPQHEKLQNKATKSFRINPPSPLHSRSSASIRGCSRVEPPINADRR